MCAQKFLILPPALADARRRAGLLQKSAAAKAGVGQTVLCAMEKGRRTPDDVAVLERLADAYALEPPVKDDLLFAATHDQLMLAIKGTPLERSAELLSEALKVQRTLSTLELEGLVVELREIADGKRRVNDLARRAGGASAKEGAAMSQEKRRAPIREQPAVEALGT